MVRLPELSDPNVGTTEDEDSDNENINPSENDDDYSAPDLPPLEYCSGDDFSSSSEEESVDMEFDQDHEEAIHDPDLPEDIPIIVNIMNN